MYVVYTIKVLWQKMPKGPFYGSWEAFDVFFHDFRPQKGRLKFVTS